MKHLLGVAAACFGVAVAILLLSYTNYFSYLNYSAYDFAMRLAGEQPPTSPTLIVEIDEPSIERIGRWPWTRDKLAKMIDLIHAGSPRAIAIDLILDDPTDQDDVLAASLAHAGPVVLATRIAPDSATERWLKPNEKFLLPNVFLGHVHTDSDFDDISRRVFSAKLAAGTAVPAFSMQALRAAGIAPSSKFELNSGGATVVLPQAVNIRFIGGRQSFSHVSAGDLLEGQVKPDDFKDRIVLIGYTADGLSDQWFTPFSIKAKQKMSGVEIHANAIDTFFTGHEIAEVSDVDVLLLLFGLTFLLWWLDRRFEGMRFYAFAVLLFPGTVVISWLLLKYANVWLAFPPFWTAIVLVVPAVEVIEVMRVNRDLDAKIGRLSIWDAALRRQDHEWDPRERVSAELPEGPERQAWLSALTSAETEERGRSSHRKKLMAGTNQSNAKWRLEAVDYFNEDLVRFLSFNSAILGSIEDVIIVADPAGRVVYQNPAAQGVSGYQLVPPFAPDYLASVLDGRSFVAPFVGVFGARGTTNCEFVVSHDGKHRYNVTLAPIGKVGVVVSLHDATAQYELNQAKNDMISLVSHELRTPLTSIRGYSDMLLKYDLVAEKGKPFLSTIIEESSRLNGLIQSFLDVAYIESGRQKLELTECEINPMLKDMISILGPVAAEKQIRIESGQVSEPASVKADRLLLYQALSNLVTNAIKYSPSGTTVRLNVTNGDGRVHFHIADQGFGIPHEEAGKIFEKFYRRGNKETRDETGFGLGLAFVKEVAVKHGGDIAVESNVGKGSIFTLTIPN